MRGPGLDKQRLGQLINLVSDIGLAGHKDLSTTQRYMHLSPAAIEAAIRLLDRPAKAPTRQTRPRKASARGDIVETGPSS